MPGSKLLCLLVAGITLPAVAGAQTWGGFYIDGAIGARGSTTETTLTETLNTPVPGGTFSSTDTSKNDFGKTNFLGEFSAGWRWGGPVLIGIGAFIDAASNDAGKQTFTTNVSSPGGSFTGSDSLSLKQKDRYGISIDIAPNWRTQPYAKVTYAWSKYSASFNSSPCPLGNGSGSVSGEKTLGGWGVGAGVRHLQTDNLYFFAEMLWQDYDSKTLTGANAACIAPGDTTVRSFKIEPSNVVGVIGVGYKF